MASTSPELDTGRARRADSALAAACVCVLFVVSGSVGLIYEVAWKHIFTTVFGSTTYAVSVVIAVFMAGLALGSFVFGRVADRTRRHLLIFALLQAGIAVSGLLVPPALHGVEGLYRIVFQWSGSAALLTTVQVLVSAVILLVPTFLMGGTLPVLSRFMAARRGQVGSAVGLLYGLNTLGAAAGAFLTGFVLIRILGTLKTIYLAAAVNIAVAVVFLALHSLTRAEEPAPTEEEAEGIEEAPLGAGRLRLLLLAVAVSGFVSFSYEVLWTRLLSFRLRTTVYAFSVMLATFLLGLGLGGALVGLSRRKRPKADYWRIYGYLEAAIGICGLCTIFLLLTPRLGWASFVGRTVEQFGMSALIMLVPATLMGAAFPIACHLFAAGVSHTGRSVGSMYVANTIGAVAGALLTGFYLVWALGTQHSLALASFAIIASASLVLVLAPRSAPREGSAARSQRSVLVHVLLIWAVAIGLWGVTPQGLLPAYYVRHQPRGPERTLLGHHEGLEGVAVASELPDGDKLLSVGATIVAGTAFRLRNTQKLQAHIPMLVHPEPKEVCQIGFGSGETARIFASYDVDRFDCVEISPGVVEMADEHFKDINDGVVHKPNFNAVIMDATVYLKYTDRRYDVIANDATWPHLGGAWALFTLEYFQEGRRHLKPGGIMTSWLPLELPLHDLKSLLKSFHEAFPHVYLWSALSHQNKHALIIGSDHELQMDARQFMSRFDRFARDDLQIVNLDDPAAFLTCHLATVADMGPELAA
ncbi:MAG: fused MFS/spermidine synthase, partial [Planctomycetota bacterium]